MTGLASPSVRRGQPLRAMALVLGGWVAVRILTWQALPPDPSPSPSAAPARSRVSHVPAPAAAPPPASIVPAPPSRPPGRVRVALTEARVAASAASSPGIPPPLPPPEPAGTESAPPIPVPFIPPSPPSASARWSLDSWLLWRPGGAALRAPLPSYGASQVGAVLRYRLRRTPHGAYAYVRTAAALASGPGISADADLALGLGIRPLLRLPVRAQLEVRADRLGTGEVRGRAAVMAISELPPLPLPGQVHAELYAQAGYVAGEAGTGFVDGALRLERPLASFGPADISAGVALSAGAQRGAGRVDLGPAVTLGLQRGPGAARAALEWRLRVAGNARPGSGPALTITAGF